MGLAYSFIIKIHRLRSSLSWSHASHSSQLSLLSRFLHRHDLRWPLRDQSVFSELHNHLIPMQHAASWKCCTCHAQAWNLLIEKHIKKAKQLVFILRIFSHIGTYLRNKEYLLIEYSWENCLHELDFPRVRVGWAGESVILIVVAQYCVWESLKMEL